MRDTLILWSLRLDLPDPGGAKMPPGFGRFNTLLSWVMWIAFGCLIALLVIAAVRIAAGSRRGDGAEHAQSIGAVMVGAIIVSGATSLIAFVAR